MQTRINDNNTDKYEFVDEDTLMLEMSQHKKRVFNLDKFILLEGERNVESADKRIRISTCGGA